MPQKFRAILNIKSNLPGTIFILLSFPPLPHQSVIQVWQSHWGVLPNPWGTDIMPWSAHVVATYGTELGHIQSAPMLTQQRRQPSMTMTSLLTCFLYKQQNEISSAQILSHNYGLKKKKVLIKLEEWVTFCTEYTLNTQQG